MTDVEDDCLSFWQRNQATFSKLYLPAMRTLYVPASSAAVKRVFSHGDIMRPHRSRMSDKLLSSLVLLKCNSGWKLVSVSGSLLYISTRLSYKSYHFFDTIVHWTLCSSYYITTVWYVFQMFCIKQQVPTIVMILFSQYNSKIFMHTGPVLVVKT